MKNAFIASTETHSASILGSSLVYFSIEHVHTFLLESKAKPVFQKRVPSLTCPQSWEAVFVLRPISQIIVNL